MNKNPTHSTPVREFLVDTAVSTIIPLAVYRLSRGYLGSSELAALIYATLYPVAKSLFDLTRHKQVNPVSIPVILGILTSVGALFVGGSTRILLIRESLITAVFGLTCFVSLLLPWPLMFYFGRYFLAGRDPEKVASFNRNWDIPKVRRTHRLITTVGHLSRGAIKCAWLISTYPLMPGRFASPTYRRRRSINLGPGMILVFQLDLSSSIHLHPSLSLSPSGNVFTNACWPTTGLPVYPDIGFYGQPTNGEWKQYALPDDNEPLMGSCPFRARL